MKTEIRRTNFMMLVILGLMFVMAIGRQQPNPTWRNGTRLLASWWMWADI
jgi:hypothetical protein